MASNDASVYVSREREVVAVLTAKESVVHALEISRLSGALVCSSVEAVEMVDRKLWDRFSGKFSRLDREGMVSLVCIPVRVLYAVLKMDPGWVVMAYVDGIGAATEEYTTPFDDLMTLLVPKSVPTALVTLA